MNIRFGKKITVYILFAAGLIEAHANDIKAGRAGYIRFGCYECHGYVGQGGLMSGPKLAPSPVPLTAMIAYVRAPPWRHAVVQCQDCFGSGVGRYPCLSLIHRAAACGGEHSAADDLCHEQVRNDGDSASIAHRQQLGGSGGLCCSVRGLSRRQGAGGVRAGIAGRQA